MKLYEITSEMRVLDELFLSCIDEETGEEKEKTVARWDYKYYKAIYDIAKSKGLIDKYGIVWGGNWKQKDLVHFQLGTADNIQFRK